MSTPPDLTALVTAELGNQKLQLLQAHATITALSKTIEELRAEVKKYKPAEPEDKTETKPETTKAEKK